MAGQQKRSDFLALLKNGWDLFYALAAIESRYLATFCYSHAKFLERLVCDFEPCGEPGWVDAAHVYKPRAIELEAEQKMYEQMGYQRRMAKVPPRRQVLMGDELAEVRRRKDLVYGRKKRMRQIADKLRAQGATQEADELEHFLGKVIENPVGKAVDFV